MADVFTFSAHAAGGNFAILIHQVAHIVLVDDFPTIAMGIAVLH